MKQTHLLGAAAILGLCLLGFGGLLLHGINNYIGKDRQVTVKGLSEREVPANQVSWRFATYVTGNELPALYQDIQRTNAEVIRFLTDNGLSASDIHVQAPTVEDLLSNRYYGNEHLPFNYKLETPIQITSSDVALVQEIVMKQGDLLEKGIALGGYNYLKYDYTAFQELKQEMIDEAIRNARTTADQFVAHYGSRLGKIITADQGTFSLSSEEDNPSMMKVRGVATITYSIE